MRRAFAIAGAVLLAACADPARDAEREFDMARNAAGVDGPTADTCAAAEKARAAYLRRHDQAGYERWKLAAFAECHRVSGSGPS